MRYWTKRLYTSKRGAIRIDHSLSALYLSEYARRKGLSNLGIITNENEISEKFLIAFDIIESEINKIQNAENGKANKKAR